MYGIIFKFLHLHKFKFASLKQKFHKIMKIYYLKKIVTLGAARGKIYLNEIK